MTGVAVQLKNNFMPLSIAHCLVTWFQFGDTILPDRGFDIQDSVGLYCSRLALSAFTIGKTELEEIAVEPTRNKANVMQHTRQQCYQ